MDGAILVCDLVCMRMKAAVCSDYSIAAERVIACVIIVEITTIDKDMVSPVFGRIDLPAQGLVHEVPDEATLICRIFADKVPIFLETTHGITHCMSIFTLNQRLLRFVIQITFTVPIRIVHRANYVRIDRIIRIIIIHGTFIMDRTRSIHFLHHIVAGDEVVTETGLIAEAPDDN